LIFSPDGVLEHRVGRARQAQVDHSHAALGQGFNGRHQGHHIGSVGSAAVAVERVHRNQLRLRQQTRRWAPGAAHQESGNCGAMLRQGGVGVGRRTDHNLDGLPLECIVVEVDARVDHPNERGRPALGGAGCRPAYQSGGLTLGAGARPQAFIEIVEVIEIGCGTRIDHLNGLPGLG
jgi:hypothetical protein